MQTCLKCNGTFEDKDGVFMRVVGIKPGGFFLCWADFEWFQDEPEEKLAEVS
jgi:hypothetical protein